MFLCPQWYGRRFTGDPADRDARRRADAAAPYKKLAASVQLLTGSLPPSRRDPDDGFASTAELESYFEQARRAMSTYSFGSVVGELMQRRGFTLARRGEPIPADPWTQWVYQYIERVRDPETGLLSGKGNDPVDRMNGLFKLSCSTFWRDNLPNRHARKLIDLLLKLADRREGFGHDCADYNATMMLSRYCKQEGGYRVHEVLERLMTILPQRLESRRQPDGGFSFHPHGCITQLNHVKVADPARESDLVGTGQQVTVMNDLEALFELV